MTALDANRRLAELLGWTEIVNVDGALLGTPPGRTLHSRDQAKAPDWTGDWNACGPLMVRYMCRIRLWPHRAVVSTGTLKHDLMRDLQAGEDADTNTRRLIVEAAIAELEARG